MAARENAAPQPGLPPAALRVPEQSRRRPTLSPADRIVRQARAIDTWLRARRQREQALHARSMNRVERMDVAREVEALQRTHDAIKGRCARDLDREMDVFESPGITAVLAQRHAWFVDKLALLLGGHGVTVLTSTDNAAEALGAVVVEQPDIVLVGGSLAMMHGRALLVESRRYAPGALLVAQASDPQECDVLGAAADSVFLRHHTPAIVADALVARYLETSGGAGTSSVPERSLP